MVHIFILLSATQNTKILKKCSFVFKTVKMNPLPIPIQVLASCTTNHIIYLPGELITMGGLWEQICVCVFLHEIQSLILSLFYSGACLNEGLTQVVSNNIYLNKSEIGEIYIVVLSHI